MTLNRQHKSVKAVQLIPGRAFPRTYPPKMSHSRHNAILYN